MAPANTSESGQEKSATTKKPYERPVLVRWGSLKDITQTQGTGPLADGGLKSSTNKTGRGGHYGDYWKQLSLAD